MKSKVLSILVCVCLVFSILSPSLATEIDDGSSTYGDGSSNASPNSGGDGNLSDGGPGDENPGDENPGDENPGDENPGDENPGDENPGGENLDDEGLDNGENLDGNGTGIESDGGEGAGAPTQEELDAINLALAQALYDRILNALNAEELIAILDSFTEEEWQLLALLFTEEEFAMLRDYRRNLSSQPPETVPFTAVGPLIYVGAAAYGFASFSSPTGRMSTAASADSYVPVGTNTEDALQLNKSYSDGVLTLEAWATGEVKTTSTVRPTDIVLVLDQSGSMTGTFSGSTNRQAALKTAAAGFINSLETDAGHRLSIVTFADNAATWYGLNEVTAATKSDMLTKINTLPDPDGATRVDRGMAEAASVLSGSSPDRARVVIVFTDGVPTTASDFNTGVADAAIATAYNLKQDPNTTVYTIGIFGGANPSQIDDGSSWSKTRIFFWGDLTEADIPAGNRFLNFLSSNYKSATSIGLTRSVTDILLVKWINYTVTQNFTRNASNYYLTASNTGELNKIFEDIAGEIEVPGVSLNSSAVIRDFISDQFKLPNGVTSGSINVYTADYNGSSFGAKAPYGSATVTVDAATGHVAVTGFDFSENFVSTTLKPGGGYGKKLIIEIPIEPNYATTFGGNTYETNKNVSGVYANGDVNTAMENFQSPVAPVPIQYEIAAKDQSIYLGNPAALGDIIDYLAAYTPNGTNNADVNIVYTLKKDGTPVGYYYKIPAGQTSGAWYSDATCTTELEAAALAPALADCTDYTLSCTVSPSATGTGIASHEASVQSATVHVLFPTIAFKDAWVNVGTVVTLSDCVIPSTVWAETNSTHTTAPIPSGTAPTISGYTFINMEGGTVTGGKFTPQDESNFTVTGITINGNTYDSTKFKVTPAATCTDGGHKDDRHFTLHINLFDLVITKTVKLNDIKTYDQSFIFTVEYDGQRFSFTITAAELIAGNGTASKTIKGMKCGKAVTVTEDTGWSWRYTPTPGSVNVTAEESKNATPTSDTQLPNKQVGKTFANALLPAKKAWLSGSDAKANRYNKKTAN